MERVATETTNCNRDLFFNVECGGETFPIAIYQKLDPILWRGEAWAATEYGIERLDGRCWLKVSDLAKGYRSGGRSLPEDIAEKGAEFEADFATVWRKALDHHGFALIDTPEGEAWITRSLTKAAEIAQGAAARKAKGDAERERQEAEKEASRKAQQRFHIFNTWEFKDRPEPAWLVERVIRDKALTLIFGKSEAYKTFALIDLLASAATGLPAFDHFTVNRPGDTILLLAEDPDDAMRGRFPAWCKARGIADPFSNPLVLPSGEAAAGRFVIIGDVPLVSDTAQVRDLIRDIEAEGLNPVHIAIDTVARAMGGLDQNNAQDVGLLVAAMTQLRRKFDCAVTGAHHPNKADEKDIRGSGAFTNDLDAIIHAKAIGELVTVLEFHKLKGGSKPAAIELRGELHDVGLPERFPAFRFRRELVEKREEKREPVNPVEIVRARIMDYLKDATKTEADHLDTGTVVTNLWPPEPDEQPEEYEARKKERMADLERYGAGKRGAGAGKLSGLVKKARGGDPYKPTRWYLRADYRKAIQVKPLPDLGADADIPF